MLVEKVLQFNLTAAHFAFQQARRRALPRSAILGRAAILSYEKDDGLQDCPGAGSPYGEGRDGYE